MKLVSYLLALGASLSGSLAMADSLNITMTPTTSICAGSVKLEDRVVDYRVVADPVARRVVLHEVVTMKKDKVQHFADDMVAVSNGWESTVDMTFRAQAVSVQGDVTSFETKSVRLVINASTRAAEYKDSESEMVSLRCR